MTLRNLIARIRVRYERRADMSVYRVHSDSSMIHRYKYIDNLSLCRSCAGIPGDIVECGTWRGGMSGGMAQVLPGRRSVLFDSFQGLPAAGHHDGSTAHQWIEDGKLLEAPKAAAEKSMQRSGSTDYEIIEGWFTDSVPLYASEKRSICLLRLDGDWYESTLTCLQYLFPLVSDGGIVIFDDYGHWEGCTRAVHHYLATNDRPEPILHSRYGVAFLVKGSSYAADSWRPPT